jgi:hypothetical protein
MVSKIKSICKSIVIMIVGFTVPVTYHTKKYEAENKK